MEANPRRSLRWQAVFAVLLVVIVVTAGVLTIANSVRAATAAESQRAVLEAVRRQTTIVLCVLLIAPEDRTAASVTACRTIAEVIP